MQTRRARLVALTALIVLTHMAFGGGRVAMALYALKLGGSTFTVGLLISLLAVVPMLISVSAGRWSDRTGATTPCLLALLLVIAGMLLPWAFESLASLYVSALLCGSGFMLGHVAVNNAVGHIGKPSERTENFSYLSLGFSVSGTLGPVVAGLLIDHAGHGRAFLCLTLFPLLAFAAWLHVRRHPRDAAPPPPPGKTRVLDLLRDAPLRAVFIVSGLMSMSWDLFLFMVPIYGSRLDLSASTIGAILGAFSVATFLIRAATPWLSRSFSEWQLLTGALATASVVYIVFPLVSAVPLLFALSFLLGIGLGSAQPMVMSLIHHTAPEGRAGEAVGVRNTVMNASQTFLPGSFGAMGGALGMVPAFWIVAAILAAGSVFAHRRPASH